MTEAKKQKSNRKAVGLLSGGLDSTLAHRIISDLGFDVIAINYETPFCNCGGKSRCTTTRENLGTTVEYRRFYAGPEYIEIVKNPPHGHGKNMNICIDCRLYMLKKAKEIMENEGADFVFTGEVVWQRPMSQRRDTMKLIENESGLRGRLLRPLSAKKLKPTIPEEEGIVDRDRLLDFHGRNRTPQMALAAKLGITEYPSPAGGCMLADEHFARILKEAFEHGEDSMKIITLLKCGRHFRSKDGVRIAAGRTKDENQTLMSMSDENTTVVTVKGAKSTYSFIFGDLTEENKILAGRISARYSKVKDRDSVEIMWWRGKERSDNNDTFLVKPLSNEELEEQRI